MSFMMDLYQPLYATRPNVVPEMFAGLRPQVYDGGIAEAREREAMEAPAPSASAAPNRVWSRREAACASAQRNRHDCQMRSRRPQRDAQGIDVDRNRWHRPRPLGELFQYTVGNVTLPRQKSAMLPIITDSVEIERVSIYNAAVLRSESIERRSPQEHHGGSTCCKARSTVLDQGRTTRATRASTTCGPGRSGC